MNWVPINWDIIRNPYNWVVVALMTVILMLALHLIFSEHALPTATDTTGE